MTAVQARAGTPSALTSLSVQHTIGRTFVLPNEQAATTCIADRGSLFEDKPQSELIEARWACRSKASLLRPLDHNRTVHSARCQPTAEQPVGPPSRPIQQARGGGLWDERHSSR